jgi:hypothetical protein
MGGTPRRRNVPSTGQDKSIQLYRFVSRVFLWCKQSNLVIVSIDMRHLSRDHHVILEERSRLIPYLVCSCDDDAWQDTIHSMVIPGVNDMEENGILIIPRIIVDGNCVSCIE